MKINNQLLGTADFESYKNIINFLADNNLSLNMIDDTENQFYYNQSNGDVVCNLEGGFFLTCAFGRDDVYIYNDSEVEVTLKDLLNKYKNL